MCEGQVTEASYFKALRLAEKNDLIEIEIDARGADPKTLVERAVARKTEATKLAQKEHDSFLSFDQIWCVFDIDDHPKLQDARQQAEAHKIRLAESNPCFELWGLLHFRDHTAFIDRVTLRSHLRSHIPDYKKELPFDMLAHHYDAAVARARNLVRRCERGECDGNPSTQVFLLTEVIKEYGLRGRQVNR